MTLPAGGEDGLFDAAPYYVKKHRDLLDELADIEAGDASPGDIKPPSDPWQAVGLDAGGIATWQAVMGEIVPSQIVDPNRDKGLHVPYLISANWSQEDYAQAATRWHQAGFTPEEAKQWTYAIAIRDEWRRGAEAAEQWRSRGFTPEEAYPWVQGDLPPDDGPEFSQIFRDAGWHPYHLWALLHLAVRGDDWEADRRAWARLPVLHALACARAGLSPQEAEDLADSDRPVLDEHLEQHFHNRPPIDPYIAMLFNHHIVPWEDEESDIPFWCRRLWDLHDEDDNKNRRLGMQPRYGGPHTKNPRWKVPEERAELEKAGAARPKPVQCSNSGGPGQLEFRDGMEEWYVHCPECGVMWMGGNGSELPVHNRRRRRSR